MSQSSPTHPRPLRFLLSYAMDAPTVDEKYSNELHTLATSAGQALTLIAPDVQVLYVDAARPPQELEELVERVDAIMVLGGADVSPKLYNGDERAHELSKGCNLAADEFEIALVHAARAKQRPLFGICRGLQVMNVALGGTLEPDLGDGRVHNDHPVSDQMTNHTVSLEHDSTVSAIYLDHDIAIRSAHHQAIAHPADGVIVTGRSDDGIVEAIEVPADEFTAAVQWHPEDPGANREHMMLIASAFVDAARRARAARAN